MEGVIFFFLAVGLIVGIAAIGIRFGVQSVRKANAQLGQLAHELGLQLESKPKALGYFEQVAEVRGTYRGKTVRVYTYFTGSGKSRTQWAAVAATPVRLSGLTLRLSLQGAGSALRALFGAKEITVGDPDFDRRWFIQTNEPAFLRAALIPELRGRVDAVVRQGGSGFFETEHGAVRYVERGSFSAVERCRRFRAAAEAVCDLADVAEVYGDGSER